MTKNLLITGGSGYVGSRLIYRLLKETNINIVNYDISLFGDKHLPKDPRFKYSKQDITNTIQFKKSIEDNKIVQFTFITFLMILLMN